MPSESEPSLSALGAYFLPMLPDLVRVAALSDNDFLAALDLDAHLPTLSLGAHFSFPRAPLFAAVRAAGSGTQDFSVVDDIRGQSVTCLFRDGAVFLSREVAEGQREEREAPSYLATLSADTDTRIQALQRIVALCGATGPDISVWQPLLEADLPSDAMMATLLSEIEDSVPFRAARVNATLLAGSFDRDRFVPTSMRYWEQLCGPAPGDASAVEWIEKIRTAHVRRLSKVSQPQAFRLCAATNARAGMLLEAALPSAEDLLRLADQALADWGPFTLLSLVEAAGHRSADVAELGEAARRGAARLLSATLPRRDGVDRLTIFAECYRFVARTLSAAGWMSGQPAWWLRLCALAQADVLLDTLDGLEFDVAELREGFDAITPANGWVAEALAARESPLWRVECADPQWLRAEIVGRLVMLQHADPSLVDLEALRAAVNEVGNSCHDPLAAFAPGPLEMDVPPAETIAALPGLSDAVREVLTELSSDPLNASLWNFLDYAARHRRFDEETLAKLSVACSGIHPSDEEHQQSWAALLFAARLAASQRATGLAEAVLSAACAASSSLSQGASAVRVAMAAAAAWPEPDEYMNRLAGCLRRLAATAPPAACKELRDMIDLLCRATAIENWWRLSPARALASLGAMARQAPVSYP